MGTLGKSEKQLSKSEFHNPASNWQLLSCRAGRAAAGVVASSGEVRSGAVVGARS